MGTILKTYPTVCRVVNVWAIKGNVMTMAMTETRLASVENKNFFFEFQRKKKSPRKFSLSQSVEKEQNPTVGWNILTPFKTLKSFLKEKKRKMAKFFVVVVASVALFGCTSQAIDLSRLYGLHNKREGNMMRKLQYLF